MAVPGEDTIWIEAFHPRAVSIFRYNKFVRGGDEYIHSHPSYPDATPQVTQIMTTRS